MSAVRKSMVLRLMIASAILVVANEFWRCRENQDSQWKRSAADTQSRNERKTPVNKPRMIRGGRPVSDCISMTLSICQPISFDGSTEQHFC